MVPEEIHRRCPKLQGRRNFKRKSAKLASYKNGLQQASSYSLKLFAGVTHLLYKVKRGWPRLVDKMQPRTLHVIKAYPSIHQCSVNKAAFKVLAIVLFALDVVCHNPLHTGPPALQVAYPRYKRWVFDYKDILSRCV